MTLLARALYHNNADAPNELTFRKGEILTVLNRSPQGLSGWWICNVRGKIGLAPGNRLQLLGVVQPTAEMRESAVYDDPAGVYDVLPSPSPSEKRRLPPTPTTAKAANDAPPQPPTASSEEDVVGGPQRCLSYYSEADSVYQVPDDDVYQIPTSDEYQRPPGEEDGLYQVPPDHEAFRLSSSPTGDASHSNRSSGISSMTYQVPPPPLPSGARASTGSSVPGSSQGPAEGGSKENLATTPDSQFEDYEGPKSPRPVSSSTPRKAPPPAQPNSDYYNVETYMKSTGAICTPPASTATPNNKSLESLCSSRSATESPRRPFSPALSLDDRQRLRHSSSDFGDLPALPAGEPRPCLGRDAALDTLERLKTSTEANTARMMKFISPRWKSATSLTVNAPALRATCEALAKDVDDFIRFAYSVLAGANACADAALPKKIWKHLRPLEEHHRALRTALHHLNALSWKPEEVARLALVPDTDHLNSAVTAVRSISIDMRSLAVTTSGNASILFPASSPAASPPAARMTAPAVDWAACAAAAGGGANSDGGADYLEMTTKRLSLQSQTLTREERESLKWYAAQLESGVDILNQATDSLFKAVEKGQPPNVFVQHSKFVVMSAQKLVYIGDSVGRALRQKALAHEVMTCASTTCELLKGVVTSTKSAAERHPSAKAVQEMMDAVVKVSSSAARLQLIVSNSANSGF